MTASPVVSLLFAAGSRPDIRALDLLAKGSGHHETASARLPGLGFAVSHRADAAQGWVELVSHGLTYDCRGLAPGAAEPAFLPAAYFGVSPGIADTELEAVTLAPGPHLAGAEGLLPIVRTLAGIASRLVSLPDLAAIGWGPAASLMAPAYFARVIDAWLEGGHFPRLA